jgi:hypothetical protein
MSVPILMRDSSGDLPGTLLHHVRLGMPSSLPPASSSAARGSYADRQHMINEQTQLFAAVPDWNPITPSSI